MQMNNNIKIINAIIREGKTVKICREGKWIEESFNKVKEAKERLNDLQIEMRGQVGMKYFE